jgi:hypothetical protein
MPLFDVGLQWEQMYSDSWMPQSEKEKNKSIGVVTIGAWVPGHLHFLTVIFSGVVTVVLLPISRGIVGTASKHGHPGCRAPGTPTFEILSTPLGKEFEKEVQDLLKAHGSLVTSGGTCDCRLRVCKLQE